MKKIAGILTTFIFCTTVTKAQIAMRSIGPKAAPADITAIMQKKATEQKMSEMQPNANEITSANGITIGYLLSKKDNVNNADCIMMSLNKKVPYSVYGAIGAKYKAEGASESILGFPQMDATTMKDGAYQYFEKGTIYWSPKTNAHIVNGKISKRYMNEQYANGFLGFPVDDVKITPDKQGTFCYFEGGSIYYNNKYDAFVIAGDILPMWAKDNYEKGFAGYPIAEATPHKLGNTLTEITAWSQLFEGGLFVANKSGGDKYFVPAYNSKNIKEGAGIYAKYRALGGPNSWLGFPVEAAIHGQGVWLQQFLKGYIYRKDNEAISYVIRKGPIFDEFAKRKWEKGCGYVVADEIVKGNTTYQVFSKGTIYYLADVKQTFWKEGDNGKWELDKKNYGPQSKF